MLIITLRKKKYKLALSICLLFSLLPFFTFFLGSSLHTDNRTITNLPSTSDIYSLEWNKTWGGSGEDYGYGIALDGSGNIYITGRIWSVEAGLAGIILKYDSSGELQWNKTWVDSEGYGIAVDATGNVFITGGWTNGGVFLLKYDSSGNLLLNKTWWDASDAKGYAIAVDAMGSAFITGKRYSGAFLLKYDSSGNLMLNKTWGLEVSGELNGIAVDSSENIFITGYTGLTYGEEAGFDVLLFKVNSSGNLVLNKRWGVTDSDLGYGIALDASGNAFITGYTGGDRTFEHNVLLLKYDSSGNLLWSKTWEESNYSTVGYGYGYGIALDASGNAFVTGETGNFDPMTGEILNFDPFLLKYDSSGNLLLNKTWEGTNNSTVGYGIALDALGNVFITGSSYNFGASGHDVFLLKYAVDTDEDGLSDTDEINIYGTDPNDSDTDGDG